MKNWSIKKKLWLTTSVIILLIGTMMIWLTYFLYQSLYVEKQVEMLLQQGKQMETSYYEHGATPAFFEQLETINWLNDPAEIQMLYTDDPMLLSSGTPFEPFSAEQLITYEERQQMLEGETIVLIRPHPLFQQDILGIAIPLLEDDLLNGALFLSMPLSQMYEPFQQIQFLLYSAGITLLFVVIFIVARTIRNISDPLHEMKQLSSKMASGDFSERIAEDRGGEELVQLAKSFNSLSSALNEVETNRREFLANVSHELRTPLSYMKGYVEAVEEGVIEPKKGLMIIQKESERLERIVHDLLDLAQLEGDSYPLKKEPIALAQLIHDVCTSFEYTIHKTNVQISLQLDEEIIIFADYDRLEQVIRNLLDNALRFTPAGKKITITLQSQANEVKLSIHDQGSGIPKADLPAITERFYRVDKGRTRKDGGTGLGLAIVSQIIKRHDGTLTIESTEGIGTSVTIFLPTNISEQSYPFG
ncbi:histidine kinase [Alkalihalobacillus alcalophilus ATCC 27647 = CGMCC 1.3604]|uniref:histidine kinase n=1 Tax=Alkalihalobacillus alcalophilus ATCC 27647 = CGMCC 1.3604 TaxID=1218173 RepID=A0A094YSV8_ALKAL|nr:ATP-binding protein [Alkalihalobacillus alcalophilus]KGA96572.1 histidine kinase [Alkalihalobacillus alcalophilus ATCC 27647 = CGMCC 1.3604]MED1563522.1 ATP-binding protein [Alkalihalobacillus alcalophilus]THG91359.1 histidine kinase [Alkalihalobacillus alcalophilus ATCC 27647 = CGMCC 1.3604]